MMKSSRRRALRRQWSAVDVPSTIQKKLHKVVSRSKSLDDEVSKELLLDEEDGDKRHTCKCGNGAFVNLGHRDGSEPEDDYPSPTSQSSLSLMYDDSTDSSFQVDEDATCSWEKINDIQIEIDDGEAAFENSNLFPGKVDNYYNLNTPGGLLGTIEEIASPRSPTKRTSQDTSDGGVNKEKDETNDVPRKCARNDVSRVDADTDNAMAEGGTTDRHRRHAICEEMEKYIIVDARGHNLRKYRETLVRHRVLKELCLL